MTTLVFFASTCSSASQSLDSNVTDSLSFCNSWLLKPAKLVGDFGLLGDDLVKLEDGDFGKEFLGDLLVLPDFDFACPGIGLEGVVEVV